MPLYLLASQTLADIAKGDGNAAHRWFQHADEPDADVDFEDVFISAVSPGVLDTAFRHTPPADAALGLEPAVTELVNRFVAAGQVVPVTKPIADLWFHLEEQDLRYVRKDGRTRSYSLEEKLVLATALRGIDGVPFVLVARRQPAHDLLSVLGLTLLDPYADAGGG